jgi:hypothetical protein
MPCHMQALEALQTQSYIPTHTCATPNHHHPQYTHHISTHMVSCTPYIICKMTLTRMLRSHPTRKQPLSSKMGTSSCVRSTHSGMGKGHDAPFLSSRLSLYSVEKRGVVRKRRKVEHIDNAWRDTTVCVRLGPSTNRTRCIILVIGTPLS